MTPPTGQKLPKAGTTTPKTMKSDKHAESKSPKGKARQRCSLGLLAFTRIAEYLRNWAARWGELHPRLIAIVIGHPSPAVREHADAFRQAAMRAIALTLRLATSGESLEERARDQLAAEAAAEYATADDAATALIRALHPEDDNGAEPSARNGRAAKNRAARSHSPMNRRRHANVARLRKIQRQQASNAAKPQ
jgi:hypothetical protein